MTEQMEIENKKELVSVMKDENVLLDKILEQQSVIHISVKEKKWNVLQESMSNLQNLSDCFVSLEKKRERLSAGKNMAQDKEVAPVLAQVRGKLQKSKVENNALSEYVGITRKFLASVFDTVVPQRRNTLYSRSGTIVKPELNSLVLNQLM